MMRRSPIRAAASVSSFCQISPGKNGGEDRVAVAGLSVAAGAVALEEGVSGTRRLGAGGCGDVNMFHQVGKPGLAQRVMIAADLVQQEECRVSRSFDGADHHCEAVWERETL